MQNAVQHCSPLMLPPYLTLPADHTSASVSASILSLSLSIFITLPVNGLANERMHGYDSTPHSTHRANDYYRAQLSKWCGLDGHGVSRVSGAMARLNKTFTHCRTGPTGKTIRTARDRIERESNDIALLLDAKRNAIPNARAL